MKILSLGTELSALNGGLPEYLRYFAKVFGQSNEIVFLSISMSDIGEDFKINQIGPNAKEIVVNEPTFFTPQPGEDIFKYPSMCKAFALAKEVMLPDVVITHDWFWAPVLMSFPIDAPIIFMVHFFYTYFNQKVGVNNPVQRLSEYYSIMDSWRIVGNSESTAKEIETIYPICSPKIFAAPLGVDKTVYTPHPNLTAKVITYIGRLQGEKCIDVFMRDVLANSEWLKANGWEVWVAGKGTYLETVVDMSMAGHIKYLGVIGNEQKQQVLADTKYQVFPSMYEPWGLALNEALAEGKLCLASDVGGHSEQIRDNKNGFLVRDGKFIDRIKQIEQNPKLQEKVSTEASKNASDIREHFILLGRIISDCIRSYKPGKK